MIAFRNDNKEFYVYLKFDFYLRKQARHGCWKISLKVFIWNVYVLCLR